MPSLPRKPSVCLVSPAVAADNNGNWRTAERWRAHLAPVADARIATRHWDGEPAELLIALHARRSAAAIEAFHAAMPGRPIVVVLTGTDVYGDLAGAQRSLDLARRIVCLQPRALAVLDEATRQRAVVIVQGGEARCHLDGEGAFLAVGHLRAEKDPQTLWRALPLLPGRARVEHIGAALDETLAAEARAAMALSPGYRWLGPLPHAATLVRIAAARALVHMSRVEGGANVLIEAIAAGTPVLASRIDGNVGLLGEDYDGYFEPGDAAGLASLIARSLADAAWLRHLAAQCSALAPRYSLEAEGAAVRALLELIA